MMAVCEICGERFGEVSIEGIEQNGPERRISIAPLRFPLVGGMFGSPDPYHGYRIPFPPEIEWEAMRCPYGPHRPFIEEDKILTHKGIVVLPRDGSRPYFYTGEIPPADRSDLCDKAIMMSDEEAEAKAREILPGCPKVVVSDEVPKGKVLMLDSAMIIENKDQIPPLHLYEVTHDPEESGFICVQCGKKFPTERQMKSHIGGKHRERK